MLFSWIYPDNSSQYSSITLILGKGVLGSRPHFCWIQSSSQLLLIVPLVSGKLWDPDIERRKAPSWKILLQDGKERALSHLVVFISALSFLFGWLVGFGFVLLVQCNMKGDEGRRDGKAVEGCWGHRGIVTCTIVTCWGRTLSHQSWINLTNLFYLAI